MYRFFFFLLHKVLKQSHALQAKESRQAIRYVECTLYPGVSIHGADSYKGPVNCLTLFGVTFFFFAVWGIILSALMMAMTGLYFLWTGYASVVLC